MSSQNMLILMLNIMLYRQLIQSRDRIANGLKKLLETNDLVATMEVLWWGVYNNKYLRIL